MRSYTNKKGQLIHVSKEHLDTAVAFKEKMQRDNNNRCSWVKHRQLMIKVGFTDAENSENYRQMIKAHQKAMGKLPSASKHADMVVEAKIEAYRELVGEVAWEKHENRKYLRQINKGKREIVDGSLFIKAVQESIQNVLSTINFKKVLKSHNFSPIVNHDNTRMILVITDWHIGAVVNVEGNSFNYKIAQERINQLLDEVTAIAVQRKVYRIDIVYTGDILEHAYMRNSQAYSAEFPVAEQMVKGGRLITSLLFRLSQQFFITYRGFAGNHDRLNGDKNGNIHGDTGMVVINEIVKTFVEASEIQNMMYCDTLPYSAELLNVNGKNFKFVHGDHEKKNDDKKIKNHSANDGVIYDAIIYGHFHHYMALEVGIDKWEIRVGSLKGSDDYSETLGLGSAPSQAVILVSEDGKIEPIRIGLS